MSENAGMTLADFLRARIAERETQSLARWNADMPPLNSIEQAEHEEIWENLTLTAFMRLGIARDTMVIALLEGLPFGLGLDSLRRRAEEYAGHPDYRAEWTRARS